MTGENNILQIRHVLGVQIFFNLAFPYTMDPFKIIMRDNKGGLPPRAFKGEEHSVAGDMVGGVHDHGTNGGLRHQIIDHIPARTRVKDRTVPLPVRPKVMIQGDEDSR